jgi:hypothetical protein
MNAEEEIISDACYMYQQPQGDEEAFLQFTVFYLNYILLLVIYCFLYVLRKPDNYFAQILTGTLKKAEIV